MGLRMGWLVLAALALNACGEAGKTLSGSEDSKIEEFSISFPRDFSGKVEYWEHRIKPVDPIRVLEGSSYSSYDSRSVMGCLLTNGGRDFTLVVRNEGQDQLRVFVPNMRMDPARSKYPDLREVKLEGFSPSREFEFHSDQFMRPWTCRASISQNGDQISGDLDCLNVLSPKNNNQADLHVEINHCRLVSR